MILRSGTICQPEKNQLELGPPRRTTITTTIARGYSAVEKKNTHILTLNLLRHNILTSSSKQRTPTPLIHRILQKRSHSLNPNLRLRAIRINRLFLLICRHTPGMHGINPRTVPLWALEPRLIILHSPSQRPGEKDLREFSAGVETIRADVGVYFGDGGEG